MTQANFVAAVRKETGWETELGWVESLADEGETGIDQSENQPNHQAGELMICQEDIEIKADEAGEFLVRGRQFLGREYQYSLLMPSQQVLSVRSPVSQRLSVGTQVQVKVKSGRAKFFQL